jgi:hypothetical protein
MGAHSSAGAVDHEGCSSHGDDPIIFREAAAPRRTLGATSIGPLTSPSTEHGSSSWRRVLAEAYLRNLLTGRAVGAAKLVTIGLANCVVISRA